MKERHSGIRGLLLLMAGAAAAVIAALLFVSRFEEGAPPRNLILVVAALAAAAGLLVLGWRALRGRAGDTTDYRHTKRLFGFTVLAMAAMGFVLDALVPSSYGRFGPYRAQALGDAAAPAPVHLGEQSCRSCHEREVSLHDKDAHARVACEACHGPGHEHVAFHEDIARRGVDPPDVVPSHCRMQVKEEREWCLHCHAADPARPGGFPQIVWTEHMQLSGVAPSAGRADTEVLPCGTCHDPHEPLFMDRDLRTARLHPLVHRCEDCHGRVEPSFVAAGAPERHPVTFSCDYCHATVADEFTRSPHESLECTTCHVYFKESAYAGRIIRDTDARFCLLCHERQDFRDPDGPKMIRWPSHREAMRNGAQDTRQSCIECHRPALHYPAPPEPEVDVDDLFGDEEEEDSP